MSFEHHTGTLSKLDDGYMDLQIVRRDNTGHIALAKLLLALDDGEFWDDEGKCREDLGFEYYKVQQWTLYP